MGRLTASRGHRCDGRLFASFQTRSPWNTTTFRISRFRCFGTASFSFTTSPTSSASHLACSGSSRTSAMSSSWDTRPRECSEDSTVSAISCCPAPRHVGMRVAPLSPSPPSLFFSPSSSLFLSSLFLFSLSLSLFPSFFLLFSLFFLPLLSLPLGQVLRYSLNATSSHASDPPLHDNTYNKATIAIVPKIPRGTLSHVPLLLLPCVI